VQLPRNCCESTPKLLRKRCGIDAQPLHSLFASVNIRRAIAAELLCNLSSQSLRDRFEVAAQMERNHCAIAVQSLRNRCETVSKLLRDRCGIALAAQCVASQSLHNRLVYAAKSYAIAAESLCN
jgi:hypothetical protein